MDVFEAFGQIRNYLVGFITLIISVVTAGHAILYKRDSRAAVLWVGVIWLVPIVGALLYMLFGINRIRRRASALKGNVEFIQSNQEAIPPCPPKVLEERLGVEGAHLAALAELVSKVVSRPLLTGNRISPLLNGDEAFPAMIAAIAGAQQSVSLSTYIFDRGGAALMFIEELGKAVARGVEVRVLIDDTGARYSLPRVFPLLRRAGVPVGRFLPTLAPFRVIAINLRNHRKILVVDGRLGFTGGMNIRDGYLLKEKPKHPVQDLHFQVEGPIVAQLQEVFAEDWLFTMGEALAGPKWFPSLDFAGDGIARGILDGPDEDFEKLRWTLMGALTAARHSVRIVTPYFLPDQAMVAALNLAVMRGVRVDIVLPEKNNLPFIQWATFAILWQVLKHGCRVWLTRPPFDHSKLMVVDGHWVMLGSANWDPRSLRLNFEFNVECYDRELGRQMEELVAKKLEGAREVTLEQVDRRKLGIKLRDGIARLFSPLL